MTEHALRKNPEWHALAGREHRYPYQFGGVGDNGDGQPEAFAHRNGQGEALIIPGVNCMPEEAAQLAERGAIFPLAVAEPMRATFTNERGDILFSPPSIPQKETA